ncbi:hypothetical protein AAFF_G00262190 [Aldrovandia affinis]|uniref:Uncharacterized protein n=1 Tax=Aldrovandia affinis TaxID=143900 RepID=A0AAD7SUD3_9TELE|nr:hypothetical protein AAFF_G00262190 [Aldrovandia affinis]
MFGLGSMALVKKANLTLGVEGQRWLQLLAALVSAPPSSTDEKNVLKPRDAADNRSSAIAVLHEQRFSAPEAVKHNYAPRRRRLTATHQQRMAAAVQGGATLMIGRKTILYTTALRWML